MSTVTIAEAREHLDELCASVAETGEPVMIEKDGRTFFLSAAHDSEAERRRALLLGNPENATRLRSALERSQAADSVFMGVAELRKEVGLDGRSF